MAATDSDVTEDSLGHLRNRVVRAQTCPASGFVREVALSPRSVTTEVPLSPRSVTTEVLSQVPRIVTTEVLNQVVLSPRSVTTEVLSEEEELERESDDEDVQDAFALEVARPASARLTLVLEQAPLQQSTPRIFTARTQLAASRA